MTLGTGIFAATVLVVLYLLAGAITRNQKWRLVAKVVAVVVLLAVALGAALWKWNELQNRPHPVDELLGVRLGMSTLDVKLAKGAPTAGDAESPKLDGDEYSSVWVYGDAPGRTPTLVIRFDGKDPKDLRVNFACDDEGYSTYFGLGRYSSEASILEKLGSPSSVSIQSDGLAKLVSFKPWHLAFELKKGLVSSVCITSDAVRFTEEYSPR